MTITECIRAVEKERRDIGAMRMVDFLNSDGIGPRLDSMIATLKLLVIPGSLRAERIMRDAELGACEDMLRVWLKGRDGVAPRLEISTPHDDTHKEVFKMYSDRAGRRVFKVYTGGKKS